jgi:hypothetical protein
MVEQNDEWQLQQRYMQLEGLQSLSNNQPAGLSGVVNGVRVNLVKIHDSYTTSRDTIAQGAEAACCASWLTETRSELRRSLRRQPRDSRNYKVARKLGF